MPPKNQTNKSNSISLTAKASPTCVSPVSKNVDTDVHKSNFADSRTECSEKFNSAIFPDSISEWDY